MPFFHKLAPLSEEDLRGIGYDSFGVIVEHFNLTIRKAPFQVPSKERVLLPFTQRFFGDGDPIATGFVGDN
jgi:hypothetical protein